MKSNRIKMNLIVFAMVLFISVTGSRAIYAQRGSGNGMGAKNNNAGMCMNLPGLTEDQRDQISKLRTNFMKESLEIRNKMQVQRAELKMISTGDDVDLNKVNAKIDEIADLRAQMMKMHASHRQDVRNVLNEEQQVIFDQRGPGFGMGMERGKFGKGKGQGKGMRGQGPGPYCPWQDTEE